MPMAFAAIVQRIRSFSLSIGQLTFGSFLLLLAMIVMTSVASVVSIRHIDATFAELQHLQSLGDVARKSTAAPTNCGWRPAISSPIRRRLPTRSGRRLRH